MEKKQYPIIEFDTDQDAIINPLVYATDGKIPEKVILCFFYDVLEKLAKSGDLQVLGTLQSENGPLYIYRLDYEGDSYTVMNPCVGAPLAAGVLEEMIVHGGKYFIATGGAGALKPSLVAEHLVIPTSAVRDEGVSYHYLPPSREVEQHPEGVAAIEAVMLKKNLPFIKGKTWTTSAFYRETVAVRDMRVKEGCVVVEMEAAAFFAVAEFRGVPLGQLLYAGDLVVPEGWDGRDWSSRYDHRENVFWLAVESCKQLEQNCMTN